jgi:hypothetical protein
MWTGTRGFVQEGLDEGSQAIYCLEYVEDKARPVGYGLSWSLARFTIQG